LKSETEGSGSSRELISLDTLTENLAENLGACLAEAYDHGYREAAEAVQRALTVEGARAWVQTHGIRRGDALDIPHHILVRVSHYLSEVLYEAASQEG